MIKNVHKTILFTSALFIGSVVLGQKKDEYTKKEAPIATQWQHADLQTDGLPGVSSEKAYQLVEGKQSTTVVVAIIDGGTQSFHPDLMDNVWTNPNEIANNGIDDDNNGYVDDIHGWSFIGGKNGDVEFDNLEFTRAYKELRKRFKGKSRSEIAKEDMADYERYLKMEIDYDNRIQGAKNEQTELDNIERFREKADKEMAKVLGKKNYTVEEVESINTSDKFTSAAKEFMILYLKEDLKEQIEEGKEHAAAQLNYSYNLEYDSRNIVGDNYSNANEKGYGNNHVDGPGAEHGTHVGGIVGATHNGFGIDGIATNVKLMIIRCVPNGDERDKDVANSIRYAVDNGARIINMSFGKSISPFKSVIDDAVKYAESKGVLLVHAAGNDGKNLDTGANFPTAVYSDGGVCSTWITIGASGPEKDKLAASFSNYGVKMVDVFAPGVDIYSCAPDSVYKKNSGTSMAAPVAAGVAAAVLSYYPNLSAKDLKAILMKSSVKYGKSKVAMPGNSTKKVKFKKLCVTGGVVNLYEALKMAEGWPGSGK
jgi:cell wall-associated protease